MSKTKNISVFGATGFIGSNFCKYSKHKSIGIPRDSMEAATQDLVYFIGTTDNYNILTDPTIDIKTNIELLINVLEYNRMKFEKFTINYISSWFVYGDGALPYREETKCEPKGFYSISKYAAEMFLISYCKTYNIEYRIFRLGNVFGPNDLGMSYKKNSLQYLIQKLKNGEDITLYENGDFVRDFIHVEDVVLAIDLVIEKSPTNIIINIGSGEPTKFKDIVKVAHDYHNSSSEILSVPTPEFQKLVQVRDAFLDISYIKSLGFRITKPIHEEIFNL